MEFLSGLSKASALHHNILEILPLLKKHGEVVNFTKAFNGETATSQNFSYNSAPDKQKFFFEKTYTPLRTQDQRIIGAIVIVRNISAQRAAEQKIEETESRFRVMSDHAPIALWLSGPDSLYYFFNLGWLKFTGRTLEQELGIGWTEGIHPDDFQRTIDTYLDAFNARKSFSIEYRLKRHDGEYRWLLNNAIPRYLSDGTFIGYIGSCTDITDQKSALSRLDQVVVKLEEALKIRDNFLSIASHELKTPITPLKIHIQTLKLQLQQKNNEPDSGQFLKTIESMDKQINRILKLVETLLDASSFNAEQRKLSIEKLDLIQIIREVIERYEVQMTDIPCRFIFSNEEILGYWDKICIDQVVDNLINNAIKYGKNGPIELHASDENTYARLKVQDSGIGIPKSAQQSIFDRFERAVPATHFGGLGLGLHIAKENLFLHGGTICVESDLNQGATFIVELPKHLDS